MILMARGRLCVWDTVGGGWQGEVEVGQGVVDKVDDDDDCGDDDDDDEGDDEGDDDTI